jgi:hypothetical protein
MVDHSNFSATYGSRSAKTVGQRSCPIRKHLGLRDLSLRTKVAGAQLLGVPGGFALPPPALGGFERDQDARADSHHARSPALALHFEIHVLADVMPDAKSINGHCERLRVRALRLAPVLRTVTGCERRPANRRLRRGAGGSRLAVARWLNRLWIGARWAAPALRSIRRLRWLFTGHFSARHLLSLRSNPIAERYG